jgi:hypothetical protein
VLSRSLIETTREFPSPLPLPPSSPQLALCPPWIPPAACASAGCRLLLLLLVLL